jgi:chromosome segregation ATPase
MYLEERIEQVERQNETTARAVADLTVDVRTIRHDQTVGFKQVNARLDKVDLRLDKLETRLENVEIRLERVENDIIILKQDVAELKRDVAELKQDMGTMKQTLQLILAYLHEKLP